MKYIIGPCTWDDNNKLEKDLIEIIKLFENRDDDFYFKSSWLKDNRSLAESYRGPGIEGIEFLLSLKEKYKVKVCTDFHDHETVTKFGKYFDIVQIPAFLSKQTSLIEASAKVCNLINIKKAQWLNGKDMSGAVSKAKFVNSDAKIIVTDRGTYGIQNQLYMDPRIILEIRNYSNVDYVGVDITHPTKGHEERGNSVFSESLLIARAYDISGVDFIFMEVTNDVTKAKCDKDTMLNIKEANSIICNVRG